MLYEQAIFKVYNAQKEAMIAFAVSKKWVKIGMDTEYMTGLAEEVLYKTCKSKQAKIGFNDEEHIRKFIWNVLRSSIKRSWATMGRAAIPALTDKERMDNFQLAKDIINSHRK